MINTLTSSSQHLYATGGGGTLPFVSYNPSNPMQGMMRVNGSEMEVFDGHSWLKVYSGSANVGLNSAASAAIDWAIKKMTQEQEIAALATKNKAVQIALDHLAEAQRQLEVTAQLARDYDTTS